MTDQEFNLYMKKFNNRFFVIIDEDNVRIINGRYGKIAPYSPEKRLLGVWCINTSAKRIDFKAFSAFYNALTSLLERVVYLWLIL